MRLVAKFPLFMILLILFTFSSVAQNVFLAEPLNNSTCISITPTLKWYDFGAERYRLEVSELVDFSTTVADTAGLTDTSFSVSLPDYDVMYYWRVSATFSGNVTRTSAIWRFETKAAPPATQTPTDKERCVALRANFSWASVVGSQDYHLQISSSPNFTTLAYNNDQVPGVTINVDLALYYNTYYWRVKSYLSGCETDWSPVREFTTLPQPPVLTYPVQNAKGVPFDDELKWNAVSGASGYDIQVADNATFTSPIVNITDYTDITFMLNLSEYDKLYYWRVRSKFTDCASSWSTVRTFKTPYRQARLATPADSARCVSLMPQFNWDVVSPATGYRLQVAESNTFGSTNVIDQLVPNDTFFVGSLAKDLTDYFWRVRAEDTSNAGVWSNVRYFKSTVYSPTLLEPGNNSSGNPIGITFRWSDDYPTGVFAIRVSEHQDMSNPFLTVSNLISPEYAYILPGYNKDYYWQVKVFYNNCASDWSPVSKFRTVIGRPKLVNPVMNSTNQPLSPVYLWDAVVDALSYEIMVTPDSNFVDNLLGLKGVTNSQVVLSELLINTLYYWRVRAVNNDGVGDWSDVGRFSTGGRGPEIPVLISPNNNAVKVPVPVEFVWNKADRALTYHLQIAKDDLFLGTLDADISNIDDTTVTVEGLEYFQNYYWRVEAVNNSGVSRWTNPRKFKTIALAPSDAPTLSTPPNNATEQEAKLIAKWSPVPRANGYHIQVSENFEFTGELFLDNDKEFNPSSLIDGMAGNKKYYWRSRAVNEAGNGPWSDVWNFTTKTNVSVFDTDYSPFSARIYPNPASDMLSIEFTLPGSSIVSIEILNNLGDKVISIDGITNAREGLNKLEYDFSDLSSGVYYCIIKAAGKQDIKQILITR